MQKSVSLSLVALAMAAPAFASAPVPGPLAGASFGPIGLAVAAGGYLAYRVYKAKSDR